MPVKPLPKRLVRRLKEYARQGVLGSVSLGRMKNIDHRRDFPELKSIPGNNTGWWGRRIRQMNVSRNFPRIELVIKRTDGLDAQLEVRQIRAIVRIHNEEKKPRLYKLVMPHAYAISRELIAMAKTNAPTVSEILWQHRITKRGEDFFQKLQKKSGRLWGRFKANKRSLKRAFKELKKNSYKLGQSNTLLLDYKNRKFVFMPLIDLR